MEPRPLQHPFESDRLLYRAPCEEDVPAVLEEARHFDGSLRDTRVYARVR